MTIDIVPTSIRPNVFDAGLIRESGGPVTRNVPEPQWNPRRGVASMWRRVWWCTHHLQLWCTRSGLAVSLRDDIAARPTDPPWTVQGGQASTGGRPWRAEIHCAPESSPKSVTEPPRGGSYL
jgi:hypothetical protein